MTLRKADWIFLLAVGVVILFVSLLPTPRDRNPQVPDTADHRALTSEKTCGQCHAAEASRPVPTRHPKRQDCFRCHRRAETVKTDILSVDTVKSRNWSTIEPSLTTQHEDRREPSCSTSFR